jgi:adenine-specific DNA-methyltransferase
MAKSRKTSKASTTDTSHLDEVEDYRYRTSKRKNNPPAAIAAASPVPVIAKARYDYNPHLPPVLRFDQTGHADVLETRLSVAAQQRVSELLSLTATRPLTLVEREELEKLIQQAAHARVVAEPWLEWTGKREKKWFEVDPVALHIHERISAQAILKVAARQDVQRSLFADPQQEYHEAVQFYKHNIDWTNRLILGDSLSVMSSLAKREDLAGKVQMIYIDPPYGIKFASNFQPEIGKRDVKDKEQDLTREPEMVRAYRDTWNLGIHSYLSYLRDRLIAARELLAATGSIFVQINDENLHRVRDVMEAVFGTENFAGLIAFSKTGLQASELLPSVCDYIIWFARNKEAIRYRPLFSTKTAGDEGATGYTFAGLPDGTWRGMTAEERATPSAIGPNAKIFDGTPLLSSGATASGSRAFELFGRLRDLPANSHWKTTYPGLERLAKADRIIEIGNRIEYKRFLVDFGVTPLSNVWIGLGERGFTGQKLYVVQTAAEAIARCLMMTTDPGDLVFDPTCGSGTTAYVAEQWGRRWITCDTSRVALSIARQRLLTAKFDYYKTKPTPGAAANDPNGNPSKGFLYKTVPHITLKSIAQNVALDPIFAKHEPILEAKLKACKDALAKVGDELRFKLEAKLLAKSKNEGKKSITDADRRRWLLPPGSRDRSPEAKKRATVDLEAKHWYAWEMPFDTDADWPKPLADAVTEYRKAWRAKMDEVNACIAASAESEELVDQPEVVRGVTRVSGPFTVEAVQPPEMSLGDLMEGEFDGEPPALDGSFTMRPVVSGVGHTPQDISAYLDKMIKLLGVDGVRFPNNKQLKFSRLEAIYETGQGMFHAEGRWVNVGEVDADPNGDATVGIVIGPQYGPVTAAMVDNLIKPASRRYDDLVVAAFSFDAAAVAILTEDPHIKLRLHLAHIRPDVNPDMEGLLKESPGGQLFTVFGLPRISLSQPDADGMYTVTMEGVDIYDPVNNTIQSSGADKVAAWFLDSDYDGRTFCVTQAFFPDRTAWDKLSRALSGTIDTDRFEAFSGTTSLPFAPGKHRRVAVKVIDPRGNEVMAVAGIEGV